MTDIRLPNSTRSTAKWNDTDHRLADLLAAHPDGLAIGQIAKTIGCTYEAAQTGLYRLERRGVLLCEDNARISLYQED